ncbi:hypothetical protein QQF64_025160, partial [Cirrhinus molitorella]
FLPMKCDACQEIFCKDHITYANHKCTSSYKKDIQVPVCPLCNTPIPIRRGEMPDIKVGEHIDRDCKSDPAQRKRKIFTNKCSKGGCKQKEMIRVTCDQCHLNYCLKHRHPLDHDCKTDSKPVSKPGHAALMRAQASSSSNTAPSSTRGSSRIMSNGVTGNNRPQSSSAQRINTASSPMVSPTAQNVIPPSASFQVGLTEEQALQRALEMSLAESAQASQPTTLSPQEQEDLALAQALAASEEEYRRQQQQRQQFEMIDPPTPTIGTNITGSGTSHLKMSDHEDLNKAMGHWNASESYQLNPASVIVSVVFSLIFLLGTIGNSLVLAVLLRSGQVGYNTTNLFILNLSVADFFFIIFCVPFQATIYSLEGWVFGSFMCKVVHFFINLTMYASSFTLAAVSVDRYLAIRYPLRSRELRTPCNAVVAMVVIWGLSLIFAGPYLSYYDLIDFENSNVCVPGWEEHNRKVLDTCTFVFGYVIPVLIVSLSYTRTIKYLWTAVDPLDGMSESKRAKRKVTKMIIIVTVLFCICWLPYHVVILCYLYGDFPFNQTTYAFRLLSHCMAYANSCLNPIVYALVSKHFRKGFKKVFSCILSKKGRNKVHVVHVANTVPGFEAGSTEVSQMNEENARQNENEMVNRPLAEPQDNTMTITLPFQNQP